MESAPRKITQILRHGKFGFKIPSDGWVKVDSLVKVLKIKMEDVQKIVATDDKGRFELKEEEGILFIRAVQGHTLAHVEIEMEEIKLDSVERFPEVIHGTYLNVIEKIKQEGLSKIQRNHIHLANGKNAISGMRIKSQVVIYIDIKSALRDGIRFYISKNGVILTSGINGILPPKYFLNIETKQLVEPIAV